MRILLLTSLLLTALPACHRYQPYTPREVGFRSQTAAYEGALEVMQKNGYAVVVADEEHAVIEAEAKLDKGRRVSHITLSALDDGVLRIDAEGEHFRKDGELAHRKLLKELDELQQLLAREAWDDEECEEPAPVAKRH